MKDEQEASAADAATSQQPSPGSQYNVKLGDSFFVSPNDLESEFLTLQYNFWSELADTSVPGAFSVPRDGVIRIDFPNAKRPGETVSYQGEYRQAKELECVLIFDGKQLERVAQVGESIKHIRDGTKLTTRPVVPPKKVAGVKEPPVKRAKQAPIHQPPQQPPQQPQQQQQQPVIAPEHEKSVSDNSQSYTAGVDSEDNYSSSPSPMEEDQPAFQPSNTASMSIVNEMIATPPTLAPPPPPPEHILEDSSSSSESSSSYSSSDEE